MYKLPWHKYWLVNSHKKHNAIVPLWRLHYTLSYMFEKFERKLEHDEEETAEFLPIVSIEHELDSSNDEMPDLVPVLPLRNTVLFPTIVIPINVSRSSTIKAVKKANKQNKFIAVLAQKDTNIDEPIGDDLHPVGVVARIIKVIKMRDDQYTVILQGRDRFRVENYTQDEPFLEAKIEYLPSVTKKEDAGIEFDATMIQIRDTASKIVELAPQIPDEARIILKNMDRPGQLINFIASNLNAPVAEKQEILETEDIQEKAEKILKQLDKEFQMLMVRNEIQNRVRTDIEKQQRDYFLNQQLKTIQDELGGDNVGSEIERLREAASKKQWNKTVNEAFNKELNKLRRMNPAVAEYTIGLNYLELLLDLPWDKVSKDNFDLKRAKKILDRDHFGLEKIKDRILEYLAVLKLKGDLKSPILCFVGPPGVGKTSLGKSIAAALNREYIRISLGGLHDEAEIRGHRKTYIGAMPGRIIQSLKKAGTSNPVFILDEIDKVGADFRGDPSSALLEVLDPEQNDSFYDNYIELEYDLSKVMFIATANSLSSIQPALLDRMEIIQLSGYSLPEKQEIAKKFLVPKQRANHGLKASHIKFTKTGMQTIIEDYTREAGVRDLDRKIAAVMRRIAKSVALEEDYEKGIKPQQVKNILGARRFDKDIYKAKHPAGVTVGLAWTSVGGEILFIETSLSAGKGTLTLTGNLGDVMKESATTALSYLKSKADLFKIDPEVFNKTNIHIHVPEGAIPKDGPSAGITMLTSLSSAFTKRKVKPFLAMTGEITLRGKVLPVGGIKEKILAAKRSGLKEIMLCELNRKDVEEINQQYLQGLTFYYVSEMKEVIDIALV